MNTLSIFPGVRLRNGDPFPRRSLIITRCLPYQFQATIDSRMGGYAKVWGHRGCRGVGYPPENSLEAFREAVEKGASGVELDVFLTSDNHLVVFHDETLDRMTDGCGSISSQPLQELKKLRLKNFAGDLTDAQIPTLNEVFSVLQECRSRLKKSETDFSRAIEFVLNIEIKGLGIAKEVVNIINEHLDEDWQYRNILVSSFDIKSLEELQLEEPKIARAALFEGPIGNPKAPWDLEIRELQQCMAIANQLHPHAVNLTLPSLSPEAIEMIRVSGAVPIAWTWDEVPPDRLDDQSRTAMVKQIKGNDLTIITDYPDQMVHLLSAK